MAFCGIYSEPYESYFALGFFVVLALIFVSGRKIDRRLMTVAPDIHKQICHSYARGDSVASTIPKSFQFFLFVLAGRYFSISDTSLTIWCGIWHAIMISVLALGVLTYGC